MNELTNGIVKDYPEMQNLYIDMDQYCIYGIPLLEQIFHLSLGTHPTSMDINTQEQYHTFNNRIIEQ